VILKNAKGFTFKNVKITSSEGPVYDLKDVSAVTISKSEGGEGADPFVRLRGTGSDKIVIESSDLRGRKPFGLTDDADASAITIKP
jgi:hypothetical protein